MKLPLRLPLVRRRPGRGMTLVEVLIASAILVFGMAGVLSILAAAQRTHQRARDETLATLVGTSVLAELRSEFARGRVPREIGDRLAEEWPDETRFRYAVKLVNQTRRKPPPGLNFPVGEEYYVEVKVFWSDARDEKLAVFRSVMFLRPPG